MKCFQDRLFKDFDAKRVTGKDGKTRRVYTYVGDYAAWNLKDEELQRYKRLYLGAGIVLLVLYVWKSLMRVPLNSSPLTGAATLFCLVALMVLLGGVWQFIRAKKEMYLRDCRQMKDLVLWGSILYLIFELFGTIAGIVFLILNGVTFWSVMVILAGLVTAFLAFVFFAAQRKLTILEIPGKKQKNSPDEA